MGGSAPQPIQTRYSDIVLAPDNRGLYEQARASRQLGESVLGGGRFNLNLASKMPPIPLDYNASALDQQARELGASQILGSREVERFTNPFAAEMRLDLGRQVMEATDPEKQKAFMDDWAKTVGLTSLAQTGIDPSSTIGRSAIYDSTTEAGRKRIAEDLATRQAYLQGTPAPMGGLDVGQSLAAQEATKAGNIEQTNQFTQQQLQNIFGLNQSYGDWVNRSMGEASSAYAAAQGNIRDYQKGLINSILEANAAQNAAMGAAAQGQQAQTGMIAGAGIGAAGLIAAAMI
jgi:hypothetical protein